MFLYKKTVPAQEDTTGLEKTYENNSGGESKGRLRQNNYINQHFQRFG
jgi:hypothetical protein